MKLLLHAFPRRWRARYGKELLALLEVEPLTWRIRRNIVTSGLRELRGCGSPQLRELWAWSLFVIGGMAFQKTSEHCQVVIPSGDRRMRMLRRDRDDTDTEGKTRGASPRVDGTTRRPQRGPTA